MAKLVSGYRNKTFMLAQMAVGNYGDIDKGVFHDIRKAVGAGEAQIFQSDDYAYVLVGDFKVLVVDGERMVCPFIEFVGRHWKAPESFRLKNYMGELLDIVAPHSVVCCVPRSDALGRMYRMMGFREMGESGLFVSGFKRG